MSEEKYDSIGLAADRSTRLPPTRDESSEAKTEEKQVVSENLGDDVAESRRQTLISDEKLKQWVGKCVLVIAMCVVAALAVSFVILVTTYLYWNVGQADKVENLLIVLWDKISSGAAIALPIVVWIFRRGN